VCDLLFRYTNTIISGKFTDNPYGAGEDYDDYYPYIPEEDSSRHDGGWHDLPTYGQALLIVLFVVAGIGSGLLWLKLSNKKRSNDKLLDNAL
jgi:hypothetical protein